jgi:type IV secretion system protein VirB8
VFNKKTKTSAKIDQAVGQSVNFELTLAAQARRSERRAWWVAFGCIVLVLMFAGGYYYMLPLKQKEPFLVMADATTGVATLARLTDEASLQRTTTSEAINRSNIAHFILARESYDAIFINLHDWTTVLTMSSPDVAASYTALYSSQNPDNPYKIYGRERAIRVHILSIVLLGGGPGRTPTGATVRLQRSLYDKQSGGSTPLDNKIATLSFTYKPNLKMDEQARYDNPLGFQVTNYRTDTDFAASPPAEVPMTPPSAPSPVPEPVASVPAAPPPVAAPPPPPQPAARPARRRQRHPRNAANNS